MFNLYQFDLWGRGYFDFFEDNRITGLDDEKKAIEFLAVHIVAGAFIGENEVRDDAILFNDLDLPR